LPGISWSPQHLTVDLKEPANAFIADRPAFIGDQASSSIAGACSPAELW
jgi:hypothetical protein